MLCVASIVPRKGQDVLLNALERLVAFEWHLTCVGRIERDSPYAAGIVRRSSEAPFVAGLPSQENWRARHSMRRTTARTSSCSRRTTKVTEWQSQKRCRGPSPS